MEDPIEKFVQFFREKKYYSRLLTVAREYPEKKAVLVDFADLDKFDTALGDSLLKDPDETLKIAEDAISEIDLPIDGAYKLKVRVDNIPGSQAIGVRNIRAEHVDTMISVEGIVKSAGDVRPEAVRMFFECPECKKEIMVKQFGKNLETPFMCDNPTCGRRGKFKSLRADLVDVQRISIQEPPENIIGGEQPAKLYVYLKDDLVSSEERKKVLPGNRVNLIGVLRKSPFTTRAGIQTSRFDLFMDANYVVPIEREFEEIELSKADIRKIKKMAKSPKIYEKLTNSIAPSIFGYETIKEAIMLQLFGGVRKEQEDGTIIRGNIHIFLVGDPAVGKSQMLWYVSRLAPKGRFVSGKKASGVGLTASVVRDEFAGGWTLEAGALILANNGIASVDEFDKMSDDDRSAMLEAMEQGTISIAKAGIVTTLRANTSVLAAANPKYGRFDKYKPLPEQINLSPVILSRFDLKFPIYDIPGKEHDTRLSDHVLGSFYSPDSIKPEIDEKMMRKYVAYAKKNSNPKITKEAKKLIQDFYVSWRSKYIGEGSDQTVAITPRQLEALVRLAEASTKVRLGKKVQSQDALRAIKLLEGSLRELATEPETGKIDIDRIDAGTSSAKRSKIRTMLEILEDLMKQVGKDVPIEEIILEAQNQGIEQLEASELISKLKQKGDLYEPRPGFLRKS